MGIIAAGKPRGKGKTPGINDVRTVVKIYIVLPMGQNNHRAVFQERMERNG
jgi:hypothetical protein